MSDPLQIAYLDGFLGGLELGALHGVVECVMESCAPAATTGRSKVNKIVARFTVPGITLDEIREGVTRICKIGENSLSGISGALEAFIMEVKGKPQSDIDDYLNIARQGVIVHPDSDRSGQMKQPVPTEFRMVETYALSVRCHEDFFRVRDSMSSVARSLKATETR